MELKIKYQDQLSGKPAAAYIRGGHAAAWFSEMNTWQIPVHSLMCFILREKENPGNTAGLFIIFENNQIPEAEKISNPYTLIAGKLFIPANAVLLPQCENRELQALLLWEFQVLHPALGFTGFEKADSIDLSSLITLPEPRETDWYHAHPGKENMLALQSIRLSETGTEDSFAAEKEKVNSKPLTDIPPDPEKKDAPWQKLLDPLTRRFLKSALGVLKGLSTPGNATGKKGLLDRLIDRMTIKLEELEKRRNEELNRLLDLFDKDSEEALEYAIPLSSPYLDRGIAPPSSQLSRRSVNFNFNQLGGGGPADLWNLEDHYYNNLKRKYEAAAEKAMANKDYKKAAYIYAHLLGNYHAAANALEAGNYFRDAAKIYSDHLKNKAMAASCLERGGLYLEAIDIYLELEQYEKAGDLYAQLENNKAANECYKVCIDRAIDNKNYQEAARLENDKLNDAAKAAQTLLEGWQKGKQQEACLLKYFEQVAGPEKRDISNEIRMVFVKHSEGKTANLLNVMATIRNKVGHAAVDQTTQSIAYEIISEKAAAGDHSAILSLKNFIPDDSLVVRDSYRYINTIGNKPAVNVTAETVNLENDIRWMHCITWQYHLLVMGIKHNSVYLARIENSMVEYHTWEVNAPSPETGLFMTTNDTQTQDILVYSKDVSLSNKTLPANKYFTPDLNLLCPAWLPEWVVALGIHSRGVVLLHVLPGRSMFSQYTRDGKLVRSVECLVDNSGIVMHPLPIPVPMVSFMDGFLFYFHDCIGFIKEDGRLQLDMVDEKITCIDITINNKIAFIAACSENKCYQVEFDGKQFNSIGEFSLPLTVAYVKLAAPDCLLAADTQEVKIIYLQGGAYPKPGKTITSRHRIIGIAVNLTRGYFSIINKYGVIKAHAIE